MAFDNLRPALVCWMFAAVTLSGAAVHAQDLTGNWQGTLQAGKELRLVFTVSKEAD